MSFDWDESVATYVSQPWWVWLAGWVVAWLGLRRLIGATRIYLEWPILSDTPSGNAECGAIIGWRRSSCRVETPFPCSGFEACAGRTINSSRGVLDIVGAGSTRRPAADRHRETGRAAFCRSRDRQDGSRRERLERPDRGGGRYSGCVRWVVAGRIRDRTEVEMIRKGRHGPVSFHAR
jgi:hypothetical protein